MITDRQFYQGKGHNCKRRKKALSITRRVGRRFKVR